MTSALPVSTTAAQTATDASSRTPAPRMPSLNQLAARIAANKSSAANVVPPTTSARPRLATSLLRTSAAAPSSASSGADAESTSQFTSEPAPIIEGDEELDEEERPPVEVEKKSRIGYKNVPSLDAINARLAMTRSLSIDGSAKPPEPETYEDPATPGVPQKAPEHPLQYHWTIYHDSKTAKPQDTTVQHTITESQTYEAGLTIIGECSTVETFCRYFNWLKPPSALERNSNYHLFKSGIKPMWEDPANANGGKWVLTMKNNPQLLDRCWSWLAMGLVGEELEDGDEICGAVVSLRSKVDRIQLWMRAKEDVEKVNGIGRKLVKLLDISEVDGIGLEFQYNSDDRPPPNKYLSIHSTFPQSGFRNNFGHGVPHSVSSPLASAVESPASAVSQSSSAFGAFAVGGVGVSPWRSKR